MISPNDIEIAPGVKAKIWLALQLDDPMSKDWEKAIDILDLRIRARYLDPVQLLIRSEPSSDSRWRYGFTILAIDCLLIETLQAFRLGLLDTYKRSQEMFRLFLTGRPRFASHFDRARAEAFYQCVRCGILHQAETRGGWRIWAFGPLISPLAKGFRINRTKFHQELAAEFEDYKTELKDPAAATLRKNLRSKMNHICTAT